MAGASALAEMSRHGRALLVEAESQTGYHSTGRSAAILAQTYGNGVVQALTRASEPFLTAPPKGFSDAPLLTPRTLIRIARPDQEPELRGMFDGLEDTGLLRWLDAEEIARRVPIIRPGYASGGFLNADAQDMDVHAMLQGYLRTARVNGAEVLTGAPVTALDRTPGGWRVEAGGRRLDAGCIINAAGAWADRVAALAGLTPVGLSPMRRSAVTFRPPAGFDPARLPMTVDADEFFYLKPEAGVLLASPANETPSDPCDSRPEEIEIAIAIDRVLAAFDLDVRRVESTWAGLRTFTPDRSPVCGFDAEAEGFFWLAGQGGYGIQTAPALARLAAQLVADAPGDPALAATGLDPAQLSPARFQQARPEQPRQDSRRLQHGRRQ